MNSFGVIVAAKCMQLFPFFNLTSKLKEKLEDNSMGAKWCRADLIQGQKSAYIPRRVKKLLVSPIIILEAHFSALNFGKGTAVLSWCLGALGSFYCRNGFSKDISQAERGQEPGFSSGAGRTWLWSQSSPRMMMAEMGLPGGFWSRCTQAVTMAVRKTSERCPSSIEIEATSVPSWCASEKELAAKGPFRSETDWPEYGMAFLLATCWGMSIKQWFLFWSS